MANGKRQTANVKTSLVLGLGLLFVSCGDQGGNTTDGHTGQDVIAIQHIVFIIKENHTFDNYFGTFPGTDGATSGLTSTGQVVPLAPMPDVYTAGLCNRGRAPSSPRMAAEWTNSI
jgi:phospholipase C